MKACEEKDPCGFYQKYKDDPDESIQSFIRIFCEGTKADRCARKSYLKEHGYPAPPDLLPSGRYYRY